MEGSPKVMIDVENGNNMMFLPLDQLFTGRKPGGGSLTGLGTTSSNDTKSLIDEFKSNVNRSRARETRE